MRTDDLKQRLREVSRAIREHRFRLEELQAGYLEATEADRDTNLSDQDDAITDCQEIENHLDEAMELLDNV